MLKILIVDALLLVVCSGAKAPSCESESRGPTSLLQTTYEVQNRARVSEAHSRDHALAAEVKHLLPSSLQRKHSKPKETQYLLPSVPLSHVLVVAGQVLTVSVASIVVALAVLSCLGILKKCLPVPKPLTRTEKVQMKSARLPWLLACTYMFVQLMTTDQYLPNLADMQKDMATTPDAMTMTLQLNWLIKGLLVLVMAAFADYFGRKPMFLMCSVLTGVGCLSCAVAPSLPWFFAGRVLCGIGEGGEPLFAMVAGDLIEDKSERMAYTGAYFAILFLVPTLAPAYGGLVGHWLGWRAPFLILGVVATLNSILIVPYWKETRPVDMPGKVWQHYRDEFKRVLGDWQVAALVFMQGIALMILFTVDSNWPLVLAEAYHENEVRVAITLIVLAALLIPASIFPECLSGPFGSLNVLRGATALAFIPVVCCAVVGTWYVDNSWVPLFISVCLCLLVAISCCTAAFSLCLQAFQELSGTAYGLLTGSNIILGAAGTVASSGFIQHSGTQSTRLAYWLGASMFVLFFVFWPFFGLCPPSWATESDDAEDAKSQVSSAKSSSKNRSPRGDKGNKSSASSTASTSSDRIVSENKKPRNKSSDRRLPSMGNTQGSERKLPPIPIGENQGTERRLPAVGDPAKS